MILCCRVLKAWLVFLVLNSSASCPTYISLAGSSISSSSTISTKALGYTWIKCSLLQSKPGKPETAQAAHHGDCEPMSGYPDNEKLWEIKQTLYSTRNTQVQSTTVSNTHLENHDILLHDSQYTYVSAKLKSCCCLLMPQLLTDPLPPIFALLCHACENRIRPNLNVNIVNIAHHWYLYYTWLIFTFLAEVLMYGPNSCFCCLTGTILCVKIFQRFFVKFLVFCGLQRILYAGNIVYADMLASYADSHRWYTNPLWGLEAGIFRMWHTSLRCMTWPKESLKLCISYTLLTHYLIWYPMPNPYFSTLLFGTSSGPLR